MIIILDYESFLSIWSRVANFGAVVVPFQQLERTMRAVRMKVMTVQFALFVT